MQQALGYRGGTAASSNVVESGAVGNYEVVDFGYGRPDDTDLPVDLPLLEIDTVAQPDTTGAPRPDVSLPPRRVALALALMFVLGLTTGIVALQARGDAAEAPLALEAGQATVTGNPAPLGESFAATSVAVPVHNTGQHDVAVLSVTLVAWQQDQFGSAREPVTVPAGQTRTVRTGVQLDCGQPRPPTASVVEIRARTGALGVISMTTPLSEPARELSQAWQVFCTPRRE